MALEKPSGEGIESAGKEAAGGAMVVSGKERASTTVCEESNATLGMPYPKENSSALPRTIDTSADRLTTVFIQGLNMG